MKKNCLKTSVVALLVSASISNAYAVDNVCKTNEECATSADPVSFIAIRVEKDKGRIYRCKITRNRTSPAKVEIVGFKGYSAGPDSYQVGSNLDVTVVGSFPGTSTKGYIAVRKRESEHGVILTTTCSPAG